MKNFIFISIFSISLWAFQTEIYLLPDESELLLYDIGKDIKKSKKKIKISLSSFDNRKILKLLRKQNNRGVEISIIVDGDEFSNKSSLFRNLAILKNINITPIKGLSENSFDANFIIVKNRAYILPYGLDRDNLNKVYGVALKTDDKRVVKRLKSIFKTLKKRRERLFKSRSLK